MCPPKEAPNCKGEAWHNWFAGVLNEPGPGSRSAASPLCRLLATAASGLPSSDDERSPCDRVMRRRYYDLDEYSTANTIIGHDNTDLPPKTHDPEWTYLTAGRLQLGDFSTAESVRATFP